MKNSFVCVVVILLLGLALVDARRARPRRPFTAAAFKWNTCDGAKGAVVEALSVEPFPLILGANVTVDGAIRVNEPFDASTITTIKVKVSKQVLGAWVPVPCIDGVGSCTYETNVCDDLEKEKDQICPILQPLGLPCQCPFAAGVYKGPAGGVSVEIPNPGGSSWLTTGNFYVKVMLGGLDGQYSCTEIYFSLAKARGRPKVYLST